MNCIRYTYINLFGPFRKYYIEMGCGASNVSTAATTNNQPQTRQVTSNAVPRIVHKPLTQPKNYRHGSTITQVFYIILYFAF